MSWFGRIGRRLASAMQSFVRPQHVDTALVIPRWQGAQRRYLQVIMAIGCALVALSIAGIGHSTAPAPLFILGLTFTVLLSDWIAMPQRREGDVLTVFSDMMVVAAVVNCGFHWSILAVLIATETLRYGRVLPMTGGWLGAGFNISVHIIECAAVVSIVSFAGFLPTWVLAGAVAVTLLLCTSITMGIVDLVNGDGLATGWDTLRAEGAVLTANFPFYVLALYTMKASPFAALLGMVGPVMLTFVSTRALEQASAIERELDVDALTGIPNRRAFATGLQVGWDLADVEQKSLVVMMVDIDNFKVLNDTKGHVEGDKALAACAAALAETVGTVATAARYGGEEFGIVASGMDRRHAAQLGEAILHSARIALAPWGTTISLGVVYVTPQDAGRFGPEAIVAIADNALYESKTRGKDRMTVAGERHARAVHQLPHIPAQLLSDGALETIHVPQQRAA